MPEQTSGPGAGAGTPVTMQGDYDEASPWKSDPGQVPWTVYFYYDTRSDTGNGSFTGSVEAYEWLSTDHAISEAELKEKLIPQLTANARGPKDKPAPKGSGVNAILWTRRSYIVFALDTGEKYDPADPLRIARQPGNRPNHSFFDGGVAEIEVPGDAPIQAVWTINYRKNDQGGELTASDNEEFVLSFNRLRTPVPKGNSNKGNSSNFSGRGGQGAGHGGGHGGGRPPWANDNGKNGGGTIPP